jgi:hypothetical protein
VLTCNFMTAKVARHRPGHPADCENEWFGKVIGS